MRSLAKTTAAAVLSWTGIDAWLGRWPRTQPLVLGYHRVVENVTAMESRTFPAMAVSQQTLRAHLEWLGRHFRIVSLDELGALLEGNVPCGGLAAVTFDDGYRDVHDYALPVLRSMGVPAAVFVVSSLVATKDPPLHDQLYQILSEAFAAKRTVPSSLALPLNGCHESRRGPLGVMHMVRTLLANVPAAELRSIVSDLRAQGSWAAPDELLATLDWEALNAMQRAGIIIGSHTRTHALLTREDDATVVEELVRSRAELEAGLGTVVRHFAYPDGRFNARVVGAVAAAGYQFAYTICDHRDPSRPLLTIPRVMLWEASCTGALGSFSSSLMHCHATSVLPFPSRCSDDHGVTASGLLSC